MGVICHVGRVVTAVTMAGASAKPQLPRRHGNRKDGYSGRPYRTWLPLEEIILGGHPHAGMVRWLACRGLTSDQDML